MIRVVRLLLAIVLAVAVPTLAQPAAYAADDQQVAITLDSLEPMLPDRNATITMRGRVTNTGRDPLAQAQVLLWRDWSPITTGEALTEALDSPATQPYGGRVTDPGAFQNLAGEGGQVAPGQTVTFEVKAPVSALEMPRTGGVYLVGVHVVGKAGRRANATLGRARTFLPLPRSGAATSGALDPASPATTAPSSATPSPTVKVPTVVMLSSRPSMIADGTFADDHLADELAINGRLATLMRAALRPDVAYAIDPALLQAVQAMADGYEVRQADGTRFPGAGQAVAERWLTDFAKLDPTRGYRLPFAIPDFTPIAHQSLEDTFQRVVAASGQMAEVRGLPLLAYSSGAFLDNATLAWIDRLGAAAALVSNASSQQPLLTPDTGKTPLIAFDPGTYAGGPGPDPRNTPVQVRQRVLADTWVAAAQGSTPRVHVVASAEDAEAELAAQAGWIARVPLTDVLRGRPVEWSGELDYTPAMVAAELTRDQTTRVRDLAHAQAAFAEMMPDPAQLQRATDALVSRSMSSWWRANPNGFREWIDPLAADANQLLSGARVSLTAQKTVIMSGQAGSFPVTVTNRLTQPVRVAIDFDSEQPQRLSIARHDDIVVPAGQSVTVNVRGRAAANGPVVVSAQLSTPGGTPLGKRTRMEVRATNFGFVGWIIVVISGLVLLAATTLRIRQVARERVSLSAARRAATSEPGTRTAPPVVRIEPSEGSGE